MFDVSKLKNAYISEAADHLQKMNDRLLALEKTPKDAVVLDELMRSAHTLKSSSAMMGFKNMARLTHVMEDVFDYARAGAKAVDTEIIDALFGAVDALEISLASVKSSGREALDASPAARLKKITGVKTKGTGKSPRTTPGAPIAAGEKITHVKVPVGRLDMLMDIVEELVIDKMKLESLKNRDPAAAAVVEHAGVLISNLRYHVIQARLVPLEQVFGRFPRLVRDLAHGRKLELPSSLATLNALLVEVGESTFAIPFSAVEKSVVIPAADIKSMADQDVALIAGQDTPLARLASLFGLAAGPGGSGPGVEIGVVVKRGDDAVCVVVDRRRSEQEIVMKPLPPVFSGVKGFAGSTVLGDGRTVLVIDVNTLLEDAGKFIRTAYAA